MNDELGLSEDIEPDEDVTEGVKGGIALATPTAATAAASSLQQTRVGVAPVAGAPVGPKAVEGLL
ncbi:MAG: hypothetical protein ABSH27_07635 [Solirubrobacteraceae bacterium]|jgi:hypothetical protein